MRECEVAVVGGGPAGLSAASEAANWGAGVVVLERDEAAGGQLIKQTHRFFGSRAQYAGTRGIDIPEILTGGAEENAVDMIFGADVAGYYPDGVVAYQKDEKWKKMNPQRLIFSTGASERFLAFPGSDLPGVYGAGAVQTLMNVHGVRPGQRVLMVGAGNIGLIVSYQLLQAKVDVVAIVEAAAEIGGYAVHASKVRRLGVPIMTRHTVSRAYGKESIEGAVLVQLDDNWDEVEGTEQDIDCDAICLAVGLNPLAELMWQAGCEMAWIPELGGYVPVRDEDLQTSVSGVYVAGDASGVEEASAAMMEGRLAGLNCADSLGYVNQQEYDCRRDELLSELAALRSGPTGEKIRAGLNKMRNAQPIKQSLVEGSEREC